MIKGSMLTFSIPIHHIIEEIKILNFNSEREKALINRISEENLKPQGYEFKNDLIFFKGRILIIQCSEITLKILKEFHDGYIGGHSGIERTFNRISKKNW